MISQLRDGTWRVAFDHRQSWYFHHKEEAIEFEAKMDPSKSPPLEDINYKFEIAAEKAVVWETMDAKEENADEYFLDFGEEDE